MLLAELFANECAVFSQGDGKDGKKGEPEICDIKVCNESIIFIS